MKKSLVAIPLMALLILPACGRDEMRGSNTTAVLDDEKNAGDTVRTGDAEPNPGPQRAFSRYSFSPDGQYVLADCGKGWWPSDGDAVLWRADDGSYVRTVRTAAECQQFSFIPNSDRLFGAVVFSPDSSVMAVARQAASRSEQHLTNCQISIERVADGRRVCSLSMRPNMSPPAISFSDDGRYVIGSGSWLIGGGAVRKESPLDIWDARTGERIWDPDKPVSFPLSEAKEPHQVQYSETGDRTLTDTEYEADLKLLLLLRDVREDGKRMIVRGLIHTHGLSHFSPDGGWLVTRDGIMPDTEYSSAAGVWDARNCRLVRVFDEDDIWIEPFIFSPDGSRFLRRAYEQPRRVYETATCKAIRVFAELPNGAVLAQAPDGRSAVLGDQHEAVLFDTDSGRLIKRFSMPGSAARQAFFSPDGGGLGIEYSDHSVDRLTAIFHDTTIIYEAQAPCQELFRMEPPSRAHRYRWYPAAFSADGRSILYGGGLWDGNTGQKIRQFHIVYD